MGKKFVKEEYKANISSVKVHSKAGDKVEAYTFWFSPYDVHLFLTICEETGYIMIDSCYGQYCFSWPSYKNRGNISLKRFLFNRSNWYYVMNKFSYGREKEFKNFDGEATEKFFKNEIINMRKNGEMNEEIARELWEEIKGIEHQDEYFHLSDEFNEWFEEPWEGFVFDYSYHQKLMRDHILPLIAEWFKKNVDLDSNVRIE